MPDVRHHDVGKLQLIYTDGTSVFNVSAGLLTGADPFDLVSMEDKADYWAGLLAPLLSPVFSVTHWKSLDTNLVEALSYPFGASHDGNSGTVPGLEPYKSLTACVTGMTKAPTAANRIQQTRQFIYLRNTLSFAAGQKSFSKDENAAWDNYWTFLDTDETIWGDIQGRKCSARQSIKIQWNAFMQNQIGS